MKYKTDVWLVFWGLLGVGVALAILKDQHQDRVERTTTVHPDAWVCFENEYGNRYRCTHATTKDEKLIYIFPMPTL